MKKGRKNIWKTILICIYCPQQSVVKWDFRCISFPKENNSDYQFTFKSNFIWPNSTECVINHSPCLPSHTTCLEYSTWRQQIYRQHRCLAKRTVWSPPGLAWRSRHLQRRSGAAANAGLLFSSLWKSQTKPTSALNKQSTQNKPAGVQLKLTCDAWWTKAGGRPAPWLSAKAPHLLYRQMLHLSAGRSFPGRRLCRRNSNIQASWSYTECITRPRQTRQSQT